MRIVVGWKLDALRSNFHVEKLIPVYKALAIEEAIRREEALKKKNAIIMVAVTLSGVTLGAFLYSWYFLKPVFNAFDTVADVDSIGFSIQNMGNADAHNIKIEVNGTWISHFRMNVTNVEHEDYSTIFYGTINEWGEQAFDLARRIVPSITYGWIPLPPYYGAVDYPTYIRVEAEENGVPRNLTNDEVASLIHAFENPRAYYTLAETTIGVLRKGEIRTMTIDLSEPSHFYEVSVSSSEGTTLQFSKWRP